MAYIRVFQLVRYVLQYWGLRVDQLPIESKIIREIVIWIYRFLNWIGIFYFVYFQIAYFIHFNDTLNGDQSFEFYIFMGGALISCSKYIMITKNQHILHELIYILDENINEKLLQESRKDVYEETQKLVQKVLRVCIVILNILPFGVTFLPPIIYILYDLILGRYSPETRKFPLQVYMPFNHMESPYYELMFLVAIFSFITINFHFGGTNILLAVISAHVVGIIKDFKQTIVELDEPTTSDINNETNLNGKSTKMQQLMNCIMEHRKVIRIIELYQSVASSIIFLQYFSSMITNVLIIFKITSISDGVNGFIFMQYLPSTLFDLLTVTYSGQIIYDEMQTVIKQMYEIQWYKYDKAANHCVQIMLFRAQKTPYLTGWKMIRSNMESYKTGLSTMLSVYTVLKSVQD